MKRRCSLNRLRQLVVILCVLMQLGSPNRNDRNLSNAQNICILWSSTLVRQKRRSVSLGRNYSKIDSYSPHIQLHDQHFSIPK